MPATYDDVQTLVQSRRLADEIYRELEATKPRWMPHASSAPPPPAIEPEAFLPPPPSLPPSSIYDCAWSTTMAVAAAPAILRKAPTAITRRKRGKRGNKKARSHLHWAVLAMCVAIAVGLWRDPSARANARRQLTTETHRLTKSVGTKLGAAKSVVAAKAKRVSARII